MTDSIEQEIQAKADKAPRVRQADVEAEIVSAHYFMASDAIQQDRAIHASGPGGWKLGSTQFLTICVLQLRNGFTVTGESSVVSPKNFNAEIGRWLAYDNAVAKVWMLLGFRLRDQLAQADPADFPLGKACDLSGEGNCEACQ